MNKGRIAGKPLAIEGGRPLLVLVCLLVFVDSVGYGLIVPVLPRYSQELGVGDFGIGFLFSVYAMAVLLAGIPLGWMSDRFGRKPFIIFGMLAMSGAFIFYALAEGYWMLVVARALDGLTAAATWSAGLALLGDHYQDEVMGEKMGYAMGAAALGGIAGPLIGGVMYDLAGYRSPFYMVAALCAVIGVAAFFLREDRSHIQRSAKFVAMVRPMLHNRMLMLACLIALVTTIGFGMLGADPASPPGGRVLHVHHRRGNPLWHTYGRVRVGQPIGRAPLGPGREKDTHHHRLAGHGPDHAPASPGLKSVPARAGHGGTRYVSWPFSTRPPCP